MWLLNGKQMYKIYINNSLIELKDSNQVLSPEFNNTPYTLVSQYLGKKKNLSNYIDLCEKSPKSNVILLHAEDLEILRQDFFSLYQLVTACGGLVINEFSEILFIYRRGFWDLPKGKAEKGETKKETAIREVIEETGLQNTEILKKINITYHTYKSSRQRMIKVSHWYLMFSVKQPLIPQTKEDIEEAEWLSLGDFYRFKTPVFSSIYEVLDKYHELLLKKKILKIGNESL